MILSTGEYGAKHQEAVVNSETAHSVQQTCQYAKTPVPVLIKLQTHGFMFCATSQLKWFASDKILITALGAEQP